LTGHDGTLQAYFKNTTSRSVELAAPLQKASTSTSPSEVHATPPTTPVDASPTSADVFSRPVDPKFEKLTRSERLFSLATRTNPRSLDISSNVEFYLFMEMRAERGWASFKMTSRKWVNETAEYNKRLTEKNRKAGLPTIEKNPRALLEKLTTIEAKVLERVATGNYTCT
jgi:hypothetical protein